MAMPRSRNLRLLLRAYVQPRVRDLARRYGVTLCAVVLCSMVSNRVDAQSYGYSYVGLHDFSGSDGEYPWDPSNLTRGADSNYYGVTYMGGSASKGVIYKLSVTGTEVHPTSSFSVIHTFGDGSVTNDGANPFGRMVQDAAGNFYGITQFGGAYGYGSVYKLSQSGGVWSVQILYSFTGTSDGIYPSGGLTLISGTSGSVVVYGTTFFGGANNLGTIFKLVQSGSTWTKTIIHDFAGAPSDGGYMTSTMMVASDGNVYGTTSNYGTNGTGAVFQLTPGGTYTIIANFPSNTGPYSAGLAQNPGASTIELWGTTNDTAGTIYKLTQSSSSTTTFTYTTVYRFTGSGWYGGNSPMGDLLYSSDYGGSFYGVTRFGGPNNDGLLFNITTGGYFGACDDLDGGPISGLIWGNIGGTNVLMGTSQTGGAHSLGQVWEAYLL